MNILIIGSGGREHALAWKIRQSHRCINLYIMPGNPGTAQCGTNINLDLHDHEGIKLFCLKNDVDLVVVGPEAPLVDGLTDAFRSDDTAHISVVGPTAYASQLEGSKAFAKKFMKKYKIPTAAYNEVTKENISTGYDFMSNIPGPYVLKADGLAAGKGVLIINDLEEAKSQLSEMLDGKFGKASEIVVIEEFLSGIEFSVFALTDGKNYILLPEAKDYKRVGNGDTGLNTGGMGAISPVPFVDDILWQKVINNIIKPTIEGIHLEQMDYIGFVFFGLINVAGNPYVIEYNCRLGDPETEVVLPRIESDLVEVFDKLVNGHISDCHLTISPDAAATVMMVSGGYPGDFEKNKIISGYEDIISSLIFHSGTDYFNQEIVTSGGRVLAVTTLHRDFKEAVKISIRNANKIMYENKNYRTDIGFDL
ncbi:MAG: phosphoribosylamine--glycine ligase [Saprospiraceae bacterium]|nr:phosphoribosylamine--glycine ligase [Saprospiraceae bacterium]